MFGSDSTHARAAKLPHSPFQFCILTEGLLMGKQSFIAKSQPALSKAADCQVNSEPQNHRAVRVIVCVEEKDNSPENSHCHNSDCYREDSGFLN